MANLNKAQAQAAKNAAKNAANSASTESQDSEDKVAKDPVEDSEDKEAQKSVDNGADIAPKEESSNDEKADEQTAKKSKGVVKVSRTTEGQAPHLAKVTLISGRTLTVGRFRFERDKTQTISDGQLIKALQADGAFVVELLSGVVKQEAGKVVRQPS